MCDIDGSEMLVASHIIPWAQDRSNRGLLENVIFLCILHDALFEQGKITIGDNLEKFSNYFLDKCNDDSRIYYAIKRATKTDLNFHLPHKRNNAHFLEAVLSQMDI